MTRGALLTLSLLLSNTAIAQDLSYDDILALNPETAPARAALTQRLHPIEPLSPAPDGPRWTYTGDLAPQHWHTLESDFATCNGDNQSPIDINTTFDTDLSPIAFHYETPLQTANNTGQSIRFTYPVSKHIIVDSKVFFLREMDLHAPSENRINGEAFPLEIQLTHESLAGEIAVVALMATRGVAMPAFTNLLQALPTHTDGSNVMARPPNPAALLPTRQDYFRFNGSLTTPPCTEGVRWFVLKDPVTLSAGQLDTVVGALSEPNNRPVQALNARMVLE